MGTDDNATYCQQVCSCTQIAACLKALPWCYFNTLQQCCIQLLPAVGAWRVVVSAGDMKSVRTNCKKAAVLGRIRCFCQREVWGASTAQQSIGCSVVLRLSPLSMSCRTDGPCCLHPSCQAQCHCQMKQRHCHVKAASASHSCRDQLCSAIVHAGWRI